MTDPAARRRAAAIAGHTGDVTTARVLAVDHDASVRATAIGALARLGELDTTVLDAALRDTNVTVRRRAVELAAYRADVALLALLDDRDDAVVEAAAWACGERAADAQTIARLAVLAGEHRDALVREAAVASLGALGDEAGLTAILAATHDKPAVRRRAVLALAPFDGPAVDAALRTALGDHDWQVRQAAEDLLS